MGNFGSLADLCIILLAGSFGGIIASRFKLPTIIGYIVSGIFVSAVFAIFGFGIFASTDFISKLAELGIALLLFTAGIEFSFQTFKKDLFFLVFGVISQTLVTIFVTLIVLQLSGLEFFESLFIGVALSSSSTVFVLKMLEQKEEITSRHATIMIGWLILQDIFMIPLFLILRFFAPNEASINFLEVILKSIFLVILALSIGRFLMPKIFTYIAKLKSQEILLISVLAMSIGFAVVCELMGVPYTLGAFLAGLSLSHTVLQNEIFTEVKPLRDLFSMIFFVSVGMLLDLKLIFSNIGLVIIIFGILAFGKFLTILIINIVFKVQLRDSLRVAFGITQIGEFTFLASSVALARGWIDQLTFTTMLFVTILTMVLTPLFYKLAPVSYSAIAFFVKLINKDWYKSLFIKTLIKEDELKNHIIICGFGKTGQYVGRAMQLAHEEFVIIENDLNKIKEAETKGYRVFFGDALNIDLVLSAGLKKAKAIVITLPKASSSVISSYCSAIKNYNNDIKMIVRGDKYTLLDYDYSNDDIVEPEFEAALRIINKLAPISHYKKSAMIKEIQKMKLLTE